MGKRVVGIERDRLVVVGDRFFDLVTREPGSVKTAADIELIRGDILGLALSSGSGQRRLQSRGYSSGDRILYRKDIGQPFVELASPKKLCVARTDEACKDPYMVTICLNASVDECFDLQLTTGHQRILFARRNTAYRLERPHDKRVASGKLCDQCFGHPELK